MSRFSQKLACAFGLILILASLATDLLVRSIVRQHLLRELVADVTLQAELVAYLIPSAAGAAALQKKVIELARISKCRLTLIDKEGAVLADSDIDASRLPTLENHRNRPEVSAALLGRPSHSIRFSQTLGEDLLYAAAPLPAGAGVARVALPLTAVNKKVTQTRRAILAVSLAMLLLAMLAVVRLSRSVTRPVDEMSRVAESMAAADYAARVRDLGEDELGQLGRTLNLLAEKIQATITELSRDKSQLDTILSNIVEAVVAVGEDGRIIAVNPAFSSLFGLSLESAVGRPFVEALRHARLNSLLAGALKERHCLVEEVAVFSPEERLFETHAVPLNERQHSAGALLVLHDITRMRKLEQLRREFVANVSHELRTPLASIKGFAETLREGAVDDKEHRLEFIEAIENDAGRLTALVDDLLDLSAIESGQRKLKMEPLAVLELAREAALSLKPLADRRGVRIDIQEAPGLPAVQADRRQLSQVLRNLLDNAVKFNREGGSVKIAAEKADKTMVLSVADTGVGIPQEELPRLFERFYRVDKARSRDVGGTGLGLSIVKHIIESHGGTVEVDSRPGEGSVFRIKLPL